MSGTLFLQSEVANPYLLYKSMLEKHALYWDEANQLWAIYSYDYCVEILKNTSTKIPAINPDNEQKLNKYTLKILDNLTRLSNGILHEISKEIAIQLFSKMKSVSISEIVSSLIENDLVNTKTDWVNSVCKKLPILVVLKSFRFTENDCAFISKNIESFIKIMLPQKTEEQVRMINENSEKLYLLVEKHLSSLAFYDSLLIKTSNQYNLSAEEIIPIVISNFMGLCIQSFDAGRGLLSNSFLQIIKNNIICEKSEIEKLVLETLRFDPPIHTTRRIAAQDFFIGESQIKKGDLILLVLASANRDPEKFLNAMDFDIERKNNADHLTFGTGGHMCLAKYFSIDFTTEALHYIFKQYPKLQLLENNIEYEALLNARLPKNIWISTTI